MDALPWNARPHHIYDDGECLTAADPRASEPRGFTATLWDPQKTLLAAMLSYEDQHAVLLHEDPCGVVSMRGTEPLMETGYARISEKLSFGKTVVCIALVCASPVPRAHPFVVGRARDAAPTIAFRRSDETATLATAHAPQLEVRHPRLMRATLVVAAASVLSQWEDNLRRHAPGLRVATVANVRDLRQFEARMGRADFDVVLLKAGSVTLNYRAAGETLSPADYHSDPRFTCETRDRYRASATILAENRFRMSRPLTQAMRALTAQYVWARIIVDDFDMIRLQWADVFLPSLFTWLISATTRKTNASPGNVAPRPARSLGEFVWANMTMPALLPTADSRFKTSAVCLHCDPDYVDEHIRSLAPVFRRIVVDTGRAGDILGALDVRGDLIEMAEAGAVETAASELGIAVDSVGELVTRVLQAQVDRFRRALATLELVDRVRARTLEKDGGGDELDEEAVLDALAQGADPPPGRVVMTEALERALKTAAATAKRTRTEVGARLERLRENLKEGWCQACNVEWDEDEDEDLYIVNCCQIVLCAHCVIRPGDPPTYIRRCPHCMAAVDARENLICVGAQFKIGPVHEDSQLFAGGGGTKTEETAAEEAAADAAAADAAAADADRYAPWAGNPRLKTFLQVVEGAETDAAESDESPVEPFVHGLISGRDVRPRDPAAPRRVLVFAMYSESGDQISAGLSALGVAHARLRGSRAERNRAVADFKEGRAQVLLVTSNRDSAGLHIPEATHVVLYHRHREESVAFQCVGRAQRVGRDCSLEVVQIE